MFALKSNRENVVLVLALSVVTTHASWIITGPAGRGECTFPARAAAKPETVLPLPDPTMHLESGWIVTSGYFFRIGDSENCHKHWTDYWTLCWIQFPYKLSVKRNLSLLQSDIHWNPKHQNDSYLDTDSVNLSLISTSKKIKFTSMKVEINAMKSQEVNFQKSQKLLASRAGSSKQTIALTAFTQPAIEIEWMAIECFE